MWFLLLFFLACQPALADAPFKIGAVYDDTNCDWYVWDKPHPWGWCTVYSNDGTICRGKYWINPSPKQYLQALKRGEEVIAPVNPHPTTPEGIAAAGGLKPFLKHGRRLSVTEVAELEDK